MEDPLNASVAHPYFPVNAELPNYMANSLSVPVLLASFAIGAGAILSGTQLIVTKARPSISIADLSTAMWLGLCGFIHLFFEGMRNT